jgi:hypothetical protein
LEAAGIPDLSSGGGSSTPSDAESQLPPIDPADLPNLDVTAPPAGGQSDDINSLDLPPPGEDSGDDSNAAAAKDDS